MTWFFLLQAIITTATALTLAIAPGVIPATFGLTLTRDAFLLCYFYAATELSLAYLSLVAVRVHDSQVRRLLCRYFLFVHVVEGAAGLYGVAQGLPTKVVGNSARHFVIAAVFAFAAFRRAPVSRLVQS